ncbi:major facilitator superfamily domain-containing protein [Pestalotiopsis sp. NC0098]|nr:major facilitator superfamily domain-containing protein [Pestalotiopsis sp. NC0098]
MRVKSYSNVAPNPPAMANMDLENKNSTVETARVEQLGTDKPSRRCTWNLRSVSSQVLLVSAAASCTIGSFNALQGLGGAGQEQPYVANAATAINFALMGIVCLLGGPLVNKIGTKWCLAIGTIGDPIFAAALYQNTRYGTQWFLIFAAVFRGAASGLFWAVEGFIIIGYPRERWRGRSITTWVAFKELGSVISASINLGLSARDNKSGHVGYDVYYVTIAIMCLGLPIALLISPTRNVHHSDGTPLVDKNKSDEKTSYKMQYKQLFAHFKRKDVLLFIPYACFAYFYYSFAHTYVTKHFSVRGRALVSLLTAVASVFGSALVAIVSDIAGIKKNRSTLKLFLATLLVLVLCAASWGYFAYNALEPPAHKLDWLDPGYGKTAASVALLFLAMQSAHTYLYWNASQVSETFEDNAHLAGVVRGIESLGQSVAYGINASNTAPVVSVSINLALLVLGGTCLLILVARNQQRA